MKPIEVKNVFKFEEDEDGSFPGAIKLGHLWRIPVKEEDLCN